MTVGPGLPTHNAPVVNELAKLKPTPDLRVGLLSYGTEQAAEREGWIVQRLDLTEDLDSVYSKMMSLEIGGDTEYVGRVLDKAIDGMSWSRNRDALRVIFVAGSESADQGVESHDFRVAARAARNRGIIVNAFYAGNREEGVVEHWPEMARGGALYTNASWDLVDATLTEGFDWNALPLAEFPKELQSMTREQQVASVEATRAKRESIQTEIRRVSAMRHSIREQAMAKGFKLGADNDPRR